MLTYPNGSRLVQSVNELPNLIGAKELFLDFETTSGDPKVPAFNPYIGARILGIGVTADRIPGAWYIPMRHHQGLFNLPVDNVLSWLRGALSTCLRWINANVKFDAHFADYEGCPFGGELVCLTTASKVLMSDRISYGLKELSKDWLGIDISHHGAAMKPYLRGNKDWGAIPADVMAPYAGEDAMTSRSLWRHIERNLPEQSRPVLNTEIKLTPVLFDIEKEGMCVNDEELKVAGFKATYEMLLIQEALHKKLGWAINPVSSNDCFELLCNRWGLPILQYTKNGGPSFDKKAMAKYTEHPDVVNVEEYRDAFRKILRYRKLNTFVSMFVEPFQKYSVNGIMHPDYNQAVRTGRMSCRRPNAQNNDKNSKALIHPPPGHVIISNDYSQVEFRGIGHYIGNQHVIQAYQANPLTDFHQLIADMCGIGRRPAKSLNFGMGYGASEKRVVSMLSTVYELVADLMSKVDEKIGFGELNPEFRQVAFDQLCKLRGKQVYNKYHAMLPELRRTTRAAQDICKRRGYVFNLYGRRRYLAPDFAYKAFNAVIQSWAADLMKERTIALSPRYNSKSREIGLRIFASVHDETASYLPEEAAKDPAVLNFICDTLEDVQHKISIPIVVECGLSDKNWAIASSDKGKVNLGRHKSAEAS